MAFSDPNCAPAQPAVPPKFPLDVPPDTRIGGGEDAYPDDIRQYRDRQTGRYVPNPHKGDRRPAA